MGADSSTILLVESSGFFSLLNNQKEQMWPPRLTMEEKTEIVKHTAEHKSVHDSF